MPLLKRPCSFYLHALSNHIYAACYGCRVQINTQSRLITPGRFNCQIQLKHYLSLDANYQAFLLQSNFLSCTEQRSYQHRMRQWHYQPRISILLPVYRVLLSHLHECLQSVAQQLYPNWELCAVEDGSGSPEVKAMLIAFQGRYPEQVKLQLKENNQGITVTSQQALELATGDFIALLDHDDRLAPEALFEVAQVLNQQAKADWIYSDNDKIDEAGYRCCYHPKPTWSPELLMSYNYVLHLSVIRRALCLQIGGFRAGFEGSQDHDLYLRLAEQTDYVVHIPKVLYSWRQSADSVALNPDSKDYAYEAALRALDSALHRRGESGHAVHPEDSWLGSYRIERPIDELDADTIVTMRLTDPEIIGINLAETVEHTQAEYVVLSSGPVKQVDVNILRGLISQLSAEKLVGISPKLVNPDGSVNHCGLAFNGNGELLFPLQGQAQTESGHGAHGALPRNVSLLSPWVAVYKAEALRQVSHQWQDFTTPLEISLAMCLSLREVGYRLCVDGGISVVAEMDSVLQKTSRTLTSLWQQYPKMLESGDPFYNVNLSQEPADFSLRIDCL